MLFSALSRLAASATTDEAILLGSVSPKGRRISFDEIPRVNLHQRLGWSQAGRRPAVGLQTTSCPATRANAVFLSGPCLKDNV